MPEGGIWLVRGGPLAEREPGGARGGGAEGVELKVIF